MGDGAATDARETLKQLADAIERHFGSDLLGLYLFGSLAAGGFYPGKSDLDLMAIIAAEVEEGPELEELRGLHDEFLSERIFVPLGMAASPRPRCAAINAADPAAAIEAASIR